MILQLPAALSSFLGVMRTLQGPEEMPSSRAPSCALLWGGNKVPVCRGHPPKCSPLLSRPQGWGSRSLGKDQNACHPSGEAGGQETPCPVSPA